nr:magnesium transporter [Vibrio mexicanus]
MSAPKILTVASKEEGNRIVRIINNTLSFVIRWAIYMGTLVGASILLSKLGTIHGKDLPEDYFSNGYPTILKLLDSEVFMGFVFFVTIAIVVYVLYLLWQLHEVAVHKAQAMSSAHTQIVFALSLCGLFINKAWWVLAIIIAFTRWDVVSESISNIIRKGVTPISTEPMSTEPKSEK